MVNYLGSTELMRVENMEGEGAKYIINWQISWRFTCGPASVGGFIRKPLPLRLPGFSPRYRKLTKEEQGVGERACIWDKA